MAGFLFVAKRKWKWDDKCRRLDGRWRRKLIVRRPLTERKNMGRQPTKLVGSRVQKKHDSHAAKPPKPERFGRDYTQH